VAKDLQTLAEKWRGIFTFEMVEGSLEPTVYVNKDQFLAAMKVIKEDFNFLTDLTAVDYPDFFEGVYHLMNLEEPAFLRLKVKIAKTEPRIDSLVSLWRAAEVQERETYDMFGIIYEGHPHLERILCPDDFEGYPLRKDFKLNSPAEEGVDFGG